MVFLSRASAALTRCRIGEVRTKAGKGFAEFPIPGVPENGFDFGRLAGAALDGGGEGDRMSGNTHFIPVL